MAPGFSLYYAVFQGDGNFCVYRGGDPKNTTGSMVWCSMAYGPPKNDRLLSCCNAGKITVFDQLPASAPYNPLNPAQGAITALATMKILWTSP